MKKIIPFYFVFIIKYVIIILYKYKFNRIKAFMISYHSQNITKIFEELKTSSAGLKSEEADKRLKKHGFNELPRKKKIDKFTIFISQFKNPLIYILLFAGLISALLNDLVDAVVIFSAVFLNTIIGFVQENKANNTLNHLRKLIKHSAYVLRDNRLLEVDSGLLAKGDIIIIKTGNRVPADARLFETDNLIINESTLTGESIPVEKGVDIEKEGASIADRRNMVYASTVAVKGFGKAVVTAIGMETEIGKIAGMVEETEEEATPLQQRLAFFSNLLAAIISIIVTLVIIVGIIQGRGALEMFITGVALAVSSIPEGLIVAVTVILVLGMQRILKEKALTRKLLAVETLGSTTVICSDKTGTLTEGKMHVAHIVIGEKEYELGTLGSRQDKAEAMAVSLALQTAMMCNDAIIENPDDELASWKINGAPTEAALMSAAYQSGLNKEKLTKLEPKIAELPFESENKYMISLHDKKNDGLILYEKGAPEKLLEKSTNFFHLGKIKNINSEERKKLINNYNKMTSRGLRVIGVAFKEIKNINKFPILAEVLAKKNENLKIDWNEIDRDLIFIGFMAIKDPLRPEARETIKICREAGIRPIIITGDHQLTAKAIGLEAGFKVKDDNIVTGEFLDKISDEELKHHVKKIDIYARVSPHHKLRIVRALQSRGEVVAMTGDGINDSPALKVADIGISLGTGTDIAKEASDIILLDNNFKTIVSTVRQGRIIFTNIRKVIIYLLADSFAEVFLIIGSIIMNLPLALLPSQILWNNIIVDGLPSFSMAFEKGAGGIMRNKPIKRREPLLNKEMKAIIFIAGLIRDFFILGLFVYLINLTGKENIDYLRTLVLALLGLTSLLSMFSIRDLDNFIWKINPFSNLYLIGAAGFSFALLLSAIYWHPLQKILSTVPLDLNTWMLIVSMGIASTLIIEIIKYYFILKNKKAAL